MRIGIYCPNWVGDAVMALPFFNRVRRQNPEAIIIAIGKSWVSAIFENHPSVNAVLGFKKQELTGLRATYETGKSLYALSLDKIYILSDSYRSAYLASKSEAEERIGFKTQGRSHYLTKGFFLPRKRIHRSEKYLSLLNDRALSVLTEPGISLTLNETSWAESEMSKMGLTNPIAFSPFSVAEARSIPLIKSLEILKYQDESILIIGSKADQERGNALIQLVGKDNIYSACGKYSLRQSMALISQCKGAIATDSGLGHIAANLGVPTVSIFGAGDAKRTHPIGLHTAIVNENVYCSPCRRNDCTNKKDELICFLALSPRKIWTAFNQLVS